MELMWWVAIGWCGCALALVVFERILARYEIGFVDTVHPWRSVAIYTTLLIFSPIVAPAAIILNAPKAWKWIPWWLSFGRGEDPYSRFEQEWHTDRDMFLGMLIQRRKLFDLRLRRQNIDQWPMRAFWTTPEAVILEAVDAYRDLKSAGAQELQIWEKLDTWLDVGGSPMPDSVEIFEYLASRMPLIDPDFPLLREKVLSGHIDICCRWLEKTKPRGSSGWPPRDWLTRQLTLAEFEAIGNGSRPMTMGAPVLLHLGRSERKLAPFKLRMLAGDEVWAFSSPSESWRMLGGRAGVALVRAGRVVAHVVTQMN